LPRLFFGNSVNFLENYIASLNLGVVSPSTSINGKNPSHSEPALLQLDAEDMSKKKASWTPTPWRMIKLNVDAGFDANTQHAGLGFVARIHMGEVIFSGWSSNHLCYSAKEVECLAALAGIRITLSVYKGSIWPVAELGLKLRGAHFPFFFFPPSFFFLLPPPFFFLFFTLGGKVWGGLGGAPWVPWE